MRNACLLLTLCLLAVGVAVADVTVSFPSDNTFYCSQTNGCGFMGANGGVSAPMWTAGDFITETFTTGQPSVSDLSAHWGLVDDYGGNSGAFYEDDVFVNGVLVGILLVPDCGYCGTLFTVSGTVNFAPIYGNGTYNISIVLASTAATGAGSQWFSVLTSDGSASWTVLSTPEPGSLMLLGSGALGVAGVLRRKLWR